jgi:hypothetical protein
MQCAINRSQRLRVTKIPATISPMVATTSGVDLLGHGNGVVHLNAKIAHRPLDLLVPQQKLHGPQVAGAAVDEGCFGLAQ